MPVPVSYHRDRFPPAQLDWQRLVSLIGSSNAVLARYDGLLAGIPNASVLLSPMTTQEAVLSSRIEGTQATMGEVLEYEAGGAPEEIDPARREDIEEVLNYRQAMRQATEEMQQLPLCMRLIKGIHETLLSGVRGHDKARGRFRTIQNYIGLPGRPIEEGAVRSRGPQRVGGCAWRREKYLHQPADDALVQLAIIHAEFESLHPFLDGNGRIGRILIPLFLYGRKLLHAPMFYLSEYLEANRQQYYDRLLAVSATTTGPAGASSFSRPFRSKRLRMRLKPEMSSICISGQGLDCRTDAFAIRDACARFPFWYADLQRFRFHRAIEGSPGNSTTNSDPALR